MCALLCASSSAACAASATSLIARVHRQDSEGTGGRGRAEEERGNGQPSWVEGERGNGRPSLAERERGNGRPRESEGGGRERAAEGGAWERAVEGGSQERGTAAPAGQRARARGGDKVGLCGSCSRAGQSARSESQGEESRTNRYQIFFLPNLSRVGRPPSTPGGSANGSTVRYNRVRTFVTVDLKNNSF
jgi:hypothetical protein